MKNQNQQLLNNKTSSDKWYKDKTATHAEFNIQVASQKCSMD